MSLTHDIIKIKYIDEGYLPNHPFHMISDSEMCDAFLKAANVPDAGQLYTPDDTRPSFFLDNYAPVCYSAIQAQSDEAKSKINEVLTDGYNRLVDSILWHISQLKASTESEYVLPDWVYSYMLGSVIGPSSESLEIHDMLVLLGMDNINDEMTPEVAKMCLDISNNWVSKFPLSVRQHRNPTIFGEPHVIKYLRLQDSAT